MSEIAATASIINYLIKNVELECYDVILYIQLIYIELIKTEYIMAKLQVIINNNIGNYYGFKTNKCITDILKCNKEVNRIYPIIICEIESRNIYPECIIRELSEDDYRIYIVDEFDTPKVSYMVRYLSETEFKSLMKTLINRISLYSYKRINDKYWNKCQQIKF